MNSENLHANYLLHLILPLVSDRDSVKVDQSTDEMGVLLTLSVGQPDMGKIIGKQGNTAKTIRDMLRVYGGSVRSKVSLKINEPAGSSRYPNGSYTV